MTASVVTVQGTVNADGTLQVEKKLALPAGRVQVTVVPIPDLPKNDPFWQMLQGIWAGQEARGHVARSAKEVEAERQALREDWEQRMLRIQHLQEEARGLRERGA